MSDVISLDRKKDAEVEDLIDKLIEVQDKIEDMYVVIFYEGKLEMRGTGTFTKASMATMALNKYTLGLME